MIKKIGFVSTKWYCEIDFAVAPTMAICNHSVGEDIILPLRLVGGCVRTAEDVCPYDVAV